MNDGLSNQGNIVENPVGLLGTVVGGSWVEFYTLSYKKNSNDNITRKN